MKHKVSVEKSDQSLHQTLAWAMQRMRGAGYEIESKVGISVDPHLSIMGYAKQEGSSHLIVVSDWALDSDMLGGLVLHELSHIYFTERGAPSHSSENVELVLNDLREKEGLTERENEYLLESFNHLQNILADDLVFAVMTEQEHKLAQRFFAGWVSDRPTGVPAPDGALLARNAFAIASLRRHNLYDEKSETAARNSAFLHVLGEDALVRFEWIRGFYERAVNIDDDAQFRQSLEDFFQHMVSLMRESPHFTDLR
jgi:hypothetical protein